MSKGSELAFERLRTFVVILYPEKDVEKNTSSFMVKGWGKAMVLSVPELFVTQPFKLFCKF